MRLLNIYTYNIKIIFFYSFSLLLFTTPSKCQKLHVIHSFKEYCASVKEDKTQALVDIKTIIPQISCELKYATNQNFTKRKLYEDATTTYLRMLVAFALKRVEDELEKYNYSLKIFDAYRPYSVTKKMWVLIHDDRYVANPANGSGHNRGLAVDLTLIEKTTGKEVNMGTNFDNFTDSAHHSFRNLPEEVLKRRMFLRSTMESYGFKALETEWWHYSWPNDNNYQVLDISFKKLRLKSCR
jgi:zinc D-Ala-D-Ala dipeptidase